MEKMTRLVAFTEIKNVVAEAGREDLIPYVEKYIEVLGKPRKSTAGAETKATKEAKGYFDAIADVLTDEGLTVSEIADAVEAFEGMSTQKVTAIVKKMVEAGLATKERVGKRTIFKAIA